MIFHILCLLHRTASSFECSLDPHSSSQFTCAICLSQLEFLTKTSHRRSSSSLVGHFFLGSKQILPGRHIRTVRQPAPSSKTLFWKGRPQISGFHLGAQASAGFPLPVTVDRSTRNLSLRQHSRNTTSLLHILCFVSPVLCRYLVAEPASCRFWLAVFAFHPQPRIRMQV